MGIASLWLTMTMMKNGVHCELAAKGKTKVTLRGLLAISLDVPIVD